MRPAPVDPGTLTAGVAHDLNNVLQAIRSTAIVARCEPGVPPSVVTLLADIEHLVDRASKLTAQLGGSPSAEPDVGRAIQ